MKASVQCQNCGKTDRVNIGQKVYCASCGTHVSSSEPETVPQSAPTQPTEVEAKASAQPASQLHARAQTDANVINLRSAPETTTPAAAAAPTVPNLGDKHQIRKAKAATVAKSSSIQKFPSKNSAMPSTPSAAAPPPEPVLPTLPNHVTTQVEAMQKLAEPAAPPAKPASKPPKPVTVGIAVMLLLLGGSLIWWQNYPRMALNLAGQRAGIEASLPGYLPSSFNLAGPIAYGTGQVILNYRTANHDELKITQKRTDWDSNALLDNFVAQRSNDYLAIQGQGLTVYLYGGSKATWVNHGIWYQIEGAGKLGRDQVLKIAYNL